MLSLASATECSMLLNNGLCGARASVRRIEAWGHASARDFIIAVFVRLAPKSNAAYLAVEEATADVQKEVTEEVPNHLRDKSYFGAKKMGHGEGYQYAHKFPGHFVDQEYINKKGNYYRPTAFGYEKVHQERLAELKKRKKS